MSFSPAAPIPPWHRLGWDARSRGHEWITFDLAADGSVERLRMMGLEFERGEAE
jgi:hypothetical protein